MAGRLRSCMECEPVAGRPRRLRAPDIVEGEALRNDGPVLVMYASVAALPPPQAISDVGQTLAGSSTARRWAWPSDWTSAPQAEGGCPPSRSGEPASARSRGRSRLVVRPASAVARRVPIAVIRRRGPQSPAASDARPRVSPGALRTVENGRNRCPPTLSSRRRPEPSCRFPDRSQFGHSWRSPSVSSGRRPRAQSRTPPAG